MDNTKANNTQYLEEDEIDLRELFKTIIAGRKIIFMIVAAVVTATLLYALSLPNIYQSKAVLIPSESKSGGLGGLGGLAAMAGVDIGGSASMTPDVAFNSLLNNYDFMKKFVIENKIVEHYADKNLDKNYVFAFAYRGVYDLLHTNKSKSDEEKNNDEEKNFEGNIYKTIKSITPKFSISSDKKTALITVTYTDSDRSYPPKIINMFLRDASKYLVDNNLRIIDNKLGYFKRELFTTEGFELRTSLSAMISKILEEKVMMQSKTYYQCDVLTLPSEPYIKAKTGPKRGLVLVVSFVTSIILGIFLVFFLAFMRNAKEVDEVQQ